MSGKLYCNVSTCVHNLDELCGANSIFVFGKEAHTKQATECSTFAEKGFVNAVTSVGNMNVSDGVKQMFNKNSDKMSPKVNCQAENCTYNVNFICGAGSVEINGPDADSAYNTQCDTFRE